MAIAESAEPSNAEHWSKVFKNAQIIGTENRSVPSTLAKRAFEIVGPEDLVLEIACGVGTDAYKLAEKAGYVLGIDFAEGQIEVNKSILKKPNLRFECVDISEGLPYSDGVFSAVYARQGLHYKGWRKALEEVDRVLAPRGRLIAEVKGSRGKPIDMPDAVGHVIHYYTVDELPELFPGYTIEHTHFEDKPDYFNGPSTFLIFQAQKPPRE